MQKHTFIKENWKDDLYDFNLVESVEGHNHYNLIVNPERGGHPWYIKKGWMILFDILLAGWLPRFLLDRNSLYVEFTVEKYII